MKRIRAHKRMIAKLQRAPYVTCPGARHGTVDRTLVPFDKAEVKFLISVLSHKLEEREAEKAARPNTAMVEAVWGG